jgi:hypothetical protein
VESLPEQRRSIRAESARRDRPPRLVDCIFRHRRWTSLVANTSNQEVYPYPKYDNPYTGKSVQQAGCASRNCVEDGTSDEIEQPGGRHWQHERLMIADCEQPQRVAMIPKLLHGRGASLLETAQGPL